MFKFPVTAPFAVKPRVLALPVCIWGTKGIPENDLIRNSMDTLYKSVLQITVPDLFMSRVLRLTRQLSLITSNVIM